MVWSYSRLIWAVSLVKGLHYFCSRIVCPSLIQLIPEAPVPVETRPTGVIVDCTTTVNRVWSKRAFFWKANYQKYSLSPTIDVCIRDPTILSVYDSVVVAGPYCPQFCLRFASRGSTWPRYSPVRYWKSQRILRCTVSNTQHARSAAFWCRTWIWLLLFFHSVNTINTWSTRNLLHRTLHYMQGHCIYPLLLIWICWNCLSIMRLDWRTVRNGRHDWLPADYLLDCLTVASGGSSFDKFLFGVWTDN